MPDPFLDIPFEERENFPTNYQSWSPAPPRVGPDPKGSVEDIVKVKQNLIKPAMPEYQDDSTNNKWYFVIGALVVAIILLTAFRNGWFK